MKRVLDFLKRNVDIFAVMLSILAIEWYFRYEMKLVGITFPIVLFDLGIACFFACWMFLMGRKTRLIYAILVLGFFGFLAAAQVLHQQYFSTVFSFSKAAILSEFNTVKGEATSKITWDLWMFFAPIVLFILVWILQGKSEKQKWGIRFLIWGIVGALGIGGMFQATRLYPTAEKDSESDQYLYSTLYNNVKAVDRFGFYSYELQDANLTFLKKTAAYSDEEQVRMYLEENPYKATPNSYTGLFEGKNLVLVLCESFTPEVISEELTPTLYRMSSEGFNFVNHYAPVYQTATCDSEFISLTGMIPSTSGSPIAYHYYNNTYPTSLALLLDKQGYTSNSYHAFEGSFYNRFQLHKAYGFTKFFDWNEFGGYEEAQRDSFVEAYNWVEDKYLAMNMVAQTEKDGKTPFFDFMISVTGHIPYDRYRYELEYNIWATQEVLGPIGEDYSEEVLCYYAAQRTLEEAMGTLVEGFEADGTLEDTVFVLYGDHYPYGMSEAGLKEYYGDTYNTIQMYQTPFIIWTPGMDGKQITQVTSTFDIYPTICNLFGVDIDGEFIVGRDGLDSSKKSTVIFPDYSWLSDDAYYDATKQVVTKYKDISDEEVEAITDQVFQEIDIAQKIIDLDYYSPNKETDGGN